VVRVGRVEERSPLSTVLPIRVLVAEDNAFFRLSLHALLDAEPDFEVVGQAASGEEAVALATTLRPDIVLMDLGLPGMDGAQATEEVVRFASPTRVVVLSGSAIDDARERALAAGAVIYLEKDETGTRLIPELRSLAGTPLQ
jgi:DNA-binding NarL/FixJ family response regulator